jgi:hypothetical protein
LSQQVVHQRRLAVVNVRDDGDVANVVSCVHALARPFATEAQSHRVLSCTLLCDSVPQWRWLFPEKKCLKRLSRSGINIANRDFESE